MIIIKLIGGLGNQMFQYSAGYALAKKHNTNLFLDTRIFQDHKMHNGFELDRVFKIDSFVAEEKEIKKLIGWRYYKIGRYILKNHQNIFKGKHYYQEKDMTFNPEFLLLNDNCYLSGYWQSEKYFFHYSELIRKQFKFKIFLSSKNIVVADLIKKTSNAVSLHIRRGDYTSTAEARSVHFVCGIDYYDRAMKAIENKVLEPTYFIFSDDIEWVKKNIKIKKNHYYINHNKSNESYNDMRLMSLCDHHIVANSSFSWWGAWLNPNIDKIVIAPKKWFANSIDCTTHVPKKWLRI